jgi:hypothetical protein
MFQPSYGQYQGQYQRPPGPVYNNTGYYQTPPPTQYQSNPPPSNPVRGKMYQLTECPALPPPPPSTTGSVASEQSGYLN